MPVRYEPDPVPSTARRTPPPPPPSPDLFGHVAPASAAKPSPDRPAEWPAARTPRPRAADAPPAPASPRSRPVPPLAGEYDRTGARLRRSDGLALVVCLSHRGVRTARDSGRYVTVARPGGGRPVYAGNLYGPDPAPADDLDGCQFQDGTDRTRYALARIAADRYAVRALPSARRRAGASA